MIAIQAKIITGKTQYDFKNRVEFVNQNGPIIILAPTISLIKTYFNDSKKPFDLEINAEEINNLAMTRINIPRLM